MNAPKKQPCPECGAQCKRTGKSEDAESASYEHKCCRKVNATVKFNVRLKED